MTAAGRPCSLRYATEKTGVKGAREEVDVMTTLVDLILQESAP